MFEDEINKVKLKASSTTLQGLIAAQEGMKIRKSRLDFLMDFEGENMIILGENDPVGKCICFERVYIIMKFIKILKGGICLLLKINAI